MKQFIYCLFITVIALQSQAQPLAITSISVDSGDYPDDFITSDADLTIYGTVDPSLYNELYLFVDNSLVAGPFSPDGLGNWSINYDFVSDGTYTIALNAYHTVTMATEDYTFGYFIIDQTMTSTPPDLLASSDLGISNTDNITTDDTPSFVGVMSNEPYGISSISLLVNGSYVSASTNSSGTGWSADITTPLAPGTYSITVELIDVAGNTVTSAPLSVTIEPIAPPTTPGAALHFDGSNDLVSIPNSASTNFSSGNKFTVEFWLKVTNNAGNRVFINKGGGGGSEQYSFDHWSGSFRFYVGNIALPGIFTVLSMSAITVAEGWVHIAGTYDGAAQQMRLYKNGVLVAQSNAAITSLNAASVPTYIGAQTPTTQFMVGSMDEVRLWGRTLCQAEIQANRNCELNPSGQIGLSALYHFNHGDDAANNSGVITLADASGNGNNGTLSNFALSGSTSNWIAPGAVVSGNSCGAPSTCFKTWNGSNNSNWSTAANWTPSTVPLATEDVVIPNVANYPIIGSNSAINGISLAIGATLQVASGGSLTLNGELANAGAVTIQSGGSFLQGASSSITGAGTFSIQRQGSSSLYNMWSSPITAQTGVPGTGYLYNSAASTQNDGDDQPSDPGWSTHEGLMTLGRGYAGLGGGMATFTGTPNNGNVNYSLFFTAFDNTYTQTSAGTPFNLVGNPYPSAISAASFISANPDLHGTIYLWNDNGSNNYSRSDYAYWNGTGGLGTGGGPTPNGFIGTAQGFMVRALSGAAVANFTNAQRVAANNTQFHKPSAADSRLWFSVEKEDLRNEILIGLLEDASDEEDRLYDAVKLKGNPDISFTAKSNDTEYAILAFAPPTEGRTVPLQLQISQAGTYEFKPNTMENLEGYEVYFNDMQNNTSVLLQEGQAIPISLEAGLHTDRFFLHFSAAAITGIDEQQKTLTLFSSTLGLHIQTTETTQATVQLMDMSGRMVMQSNMMLTVGSNLMNLNQLSAGVYVARISTDMQNASQKIVMH